MSSFIHISLAVGSEIFSETGVNYCRHYCCEKVLSLENSAGIFLITLRQQIIRVFFHINTRFSSIPEKLPLKF